MIATAGDGLTLLGQTRRLAPDVVLLGMRMPPPSGVDLIGQIRQHAPSTRVVVVTTNDDPVVAAKALQAGAAGFVLKRCDRNESIRAIREVMGNRTYLTPQVAGGVIKALDSLRAREGQAEEPTSRQLDVLRLLVKGQSLKQAASSLNLTSRTVAFHKYAMMRRLKLRTSADLVRFAVERGFA